jgi:ferredoxin-NADP reductase
MIGKSIGDLQPPVYYIVGPRAMVSALRAMLTDAGANDNDICVEESSATKNGPGNSTHWHAFCLEV